jgi:hypothetical protein
MAPPASEVQEPERQKKSIKSSQSQSKCQSGGPDADNLADLHEQIASMKTELDAKAEKLIAVKAELDTKSRSLNQVESRHEEEMEATLDFWRGIAKHAILTIDKKVDLQTCTWLGNGKFGFVLKATRFVDNREVVVKMMGLRWAHLAVKEWQHGSTVGKHENIVDYDDVMLHNDDDKIFAKLLQAGYESGKLKSRQKRTQFPDRYICLTQELMNRGTVQDWMDNDWLLPGGVLCVMQSVAGALAFMHMKGVTHNDIKPENVMLHQDGRKTRSDVIVKLGDLGCCLKSPNKDNDYWQYGMTIFCMVTGEKFGTRKYRSEIANQVCDECAELLKQNDIEGDLGKALARVPPLMRSIFPMEIEMDEVRDDPLLSGWSFFEGEIGATPTDDGAGMMSICTLRPEECAEEEEEGEVVAELSVQSHSRGTLGPHLIHLGRSELKNLTIKSYERSCLKMGEDEDDA